MGEVGNDNEVHEELWKGAVQICCALIHVKYANAEFCAGSAARAAIKLYKELESGQKEEEDAAKNQPQ
jgi:hypothetical protein